MATKTKAPVGSKSDRFRAILASDPNATISTAAEACGMGYAFAYGVAKRTPDPAHPGQSYATTRANRRSEKRLTIDGDVAVIRIVDSAGKSLGFVRVNMTDGSVKRTK